MKRRRSYWVYSVGCFIAWGVVFLAMEVRSGSPRVRDPLLVFTGWLIAWVSGTMARFVHPPPARWLGRSEIEE